MAFKIRSVEYFYTTVKDQPGEAYRLLTALADQGVNLVAFTAIPMGPEATQLTLFPEESATLTTVANKIGLSLTGPHSAFLVQGNDDLGALAKVHFKLFNAGANVYAANGVSSGGEHYGYIVYVRPDDFTRAAAALGIG